jgi:acetyl esterase/lipase
MRARTRPGIAIELLGATSVRVHRPHARVMTGGASAGGGLAAALALLARDRGEVTPVFELLSYPMVDDRTALRTDLDDRSARLWNH